MLTGTDEYKRISEERIARKFGVDSFHAREMFDGETIEYTSSSTLFGVSVPRAQTFWGVRISFIYKGRTYSYIAPPIIKVVEESDLCSSAKYAVLDEDKMEEQFLQQLEELKESIRNDPKFNRSPAF